MNLKNIAVRRLRRFPQIKQQVTFECRHTFGVTVEFAYNPLKICVNLRNLRTELRF
jgi:hypothetical protein